MGECNPRAMDLISQVTVNTPVYGETEDGQQSLTIGEIVIVATSFGLRGNPTAFQHDDRTLTVSWGGQTATLLKGGDGSSVAQVFASALQGIARFVD